MQLFAAGVWYITRTHTHTHTGWQLLLRQFQACASPNSGGIKHMWRHLGFFSLAVFKMWPPGAHCVVNRRNIPSISCLSLHPLMFLFSVSRQFPTHSSLCGLSPPSPCSLLPQPLLSTTGGGPLTLTTWFRQSFISLGVRVPGPTCCPLTFTGAESESADFWVFPKGKNERKPQRHHQVKLSPGWYSVDKSTLRVCNWWLTSLTDERPFGKKKTLKNRLC